MRTPSRRYGFAGPLVLAAASVAVFPPSLVRAQTPAPTTTVRAAIRAESGSVTVPITLKAGHIHLDATINGKPVHLVFDSGAGANILTPEAAARLGIRGDGTPGRATGTGGSVEAQRTRVANLTVGAGAVLENEVAYIIPLPAELECDGLIGHGLLNRFVATIDYDKGTLTLTDPKRFRTPEGAQTLPLKVAANLPAIDGEVDGLRGLFRLDTGSNDALTLFTPFVEKHKLRDRYSPRIETMTGKGIGGFQYGDLVRVKGLKLGGVEITGVITELSRQKSGVFSKSDAVGNIGYDVLSRFAVTFDYPGKRLHLVKGAKFGEPFSGSRAGLGMDYDKGRFSVVNVIPGSPAAEAGVKVGDVLLAVDGVGVDKVDPAALRGKLRGPAGTKVELLLRDGDAGEPRKVTLTMRELL